VVAGDVRRTGHAVGESAFVQSVSDGGEAGRSLGRQRKPAHAVVPAGGSRALCREGGAGDSRVSVAAGDIASGDLRTVACPHPAPGDLLDLGAEADLSAAPQVLGEQVPYQLLLGVDGVDFAAPQLAVVEGEFTVLAAEEAGPVRRPLRQQAAVQAVLGEYVHGEGGQEPCSGPPLHRLALAPFQEHAVDTSVQEQVPQDEPRRARPARGSISARSGR